MSDFFDLPDDGFKPKKSSSDRMTDLNIYNPDPNLFNGSYKSVFRFIPYLHDKTKSKYTKYSAKFWNPLTKESLYVDCPSNVGKPSILWDLESVIRGLEKEEPELHKKLSESFSRWHYNWSPVYIKKDPQRPELEGQIKFFKFSSQINSIIEAQIAPEENELIEAAASVNPYHLLQGKDFLCVVGKKTKVFRDWTKCKFMDEVTPFVFKIGDKQIVTENSEKSIKLVQKFLIENTPKLDEYYHKEWTDDQFNSVVESIVSLIQPRPVLDLLLNKTKDTVMKNAIEARLSKTNTITVNNIDDSIEFESKNKPNTSNTDLKTKPELSKQVASDEYDDLFNDL